MCKESLIRLDNACKRHAKLPVPLSVLQDAESLAFAVRRPVVYKGVCNLEMMYLGQANAEVRNFLAKLILLRQEPGVDVGNHADIIALINKIRAGLDIAEEQLGAIREDKFDAEDRAHELSKSPALLATA